MVCGATRGTLADHLGSGSPSSHLEPDRGGARRKKGREGDGEARMFGVARVTWAVRARQFMQRAEIRFGCAYARKALHVP